MRGDIQDFKETKELAREGAGVEKQQEQLLMSKLASNGKLPAKPQTAFLQKKLQQQRKFFDSGDYAMNKDKAKNPIALAPAKVPTSSRQLPVAAAEKQEAAAANVDTSPVDESLQIPRPDTVPQRKSSIIYPSVHSKLSPQMHIHHTSHDDPLADP